MQRSGKNRHSSKAGMTMVEVLVAFVIVMLMVTLFARAMSSAVHIWNLSQESVAQEEAFEEAYYAGEGTVAPAAEDLVLTDGEEELTVTGGKLQLFSTEDGRKRYFFEVKE